MAYIDLHVHIDYYKDFLKVFKTYDEMKIYALFVTNLPEVYEASLKSLPKSKYVRIALGYNPQLISVERFNKRVFDKYLSTTEYIGEVGLDFSKEFAASKLAQVETFDYIVKRASEENKILSVHSRNAVAEVLEILDKYNARSVIFHWYTGKLEQISEIVSRGYYFSINTQMLSSVKGKRLVEEMPTDRLLFESDGPFTKFKGDTFRPERIDEIYRYMETRIGLSNFDRIVSENLRALLSTKDERK